MRLRPSSVLPALLISLGCAAAGRAAMVVESTLSLVEAQIVFHLDEQRQYDLWADLHSAGRANETAALQLQPEATAGPMVALSGPLASGYGALDAGAYRLWTESTAIPANGQAALHDMESGVQTGSVLTLTPEPGLGPLLIASLALLVLGGPRSLRWR